jgi:hypothetical protein
MKNFENVLQAVREGKEFFMPIGGQGFSIRDFKDSKVSGGRADAFLREAKARNRKMNPISPNQADYVNWPLYDRISFAASAVVPNLVKLFVAPIGSGTKTKVDTNLEQVSTLPAPQWFNATGISFYFNPNTAPIDLDNFLTTEYMEFWVSQKVYAEGPLDIYPSAGGLFANVALGTMGAAATSYATNTTNGWPSIHNMYDLRLPTGLPLGTDQTGASVVADGIIGVTILQSQTFNVQLKADGGGATMAANNAVPIAGVGLTVSCRLHGILSRGVQ